MAAITQSGGTIKSITAEGHLLEAIQLVRLVEQNTSNNPNNTRIVVSAQYNLSSNVFNASVSIPVIQQLNTSGQPVRVAQNPFMGVTFTSGNGVFKSTNLVAYLLEVISYNQMLEADPTKNLLGSNNVSTVFDGDQQTESVTITLPIQATIDSSGRILVEAKPYLA